MYSPKFSTRSIDILSTGSYIQELYFPKISAQMVRNLALQVQYTKRVRNFFFKIRLQKMTKNSDFHYFLETYFSKILGMPFSILGLQGQVSNEA